MDNINNNFEKYYRLNTPQMQLPQQQQPTIGQEHIDLDNSQHRHSLHDSFDQQSLLNLVSNDFYSSGHFASNVNSSSSSSNILMNSQYKPHNDDQSLFLDQISRSTISEQMNRNDISSSIPAYLPSSQSFQPDESLPIDQLQQRRNNDMAYNHDNNANICKNVGINNLNISSNYIFPEEQQVLLNAANTMLPSFEQSQPLLATSSAHSNLQSKPRQEQDVFCELISLATINNNMRQPNMGTWQNHSNHHNSVQYIPPPFSSTEFPANAQRQIQHQLFLQQQQNNKNQNYFTTSSTSSSNYTSTSAEAATAAAAAVLASSSNASKKLIPPSQITDDESIYIPNYNGRVYELKIAQQPSRARMCGFGDKDRRPISPPPIVQLIVTTKEGQIINPETFDASFLIVMCDSLQQNDPNDGDIDSSNHENPFSQVISYPTSTTDDDESSSNTAIRMRNLVGSSVSSATKLYDLDGKLGIFFVFQDISLRTEGCFRLKFSLVDVGSPYSHNVNTTSVSHVLKTIHTGPFMVYTAKKFPGVVQSTALSKCFARQGIKIPIRKEKNNSSKRSQLNTELSDDENDQDDKT